MQFRLIQTAHTNIANQVYNESRWYHVYINNFGNHSKPFEIHIIEQIMINRIFASIKAAAIISNDEQMTETMVEARLRHMTTVAS